LEAMMKDPYIVDDIIDDHDERGIIIHNNAVKYKPYGVKTLEIL
jgi:hypothetical protein